MCKGSLRLDGNQPQSVKAEGSLTARPTSRAGAKAGLSDPTVPSGRAVCSTDKSYSRDNRQKSVPLEW